jgi:hypothetical protein
MRLPDAATSTWRVISKQLKQQSNAAKSPAGKIDYMAALKIRLR